MPATIVHGVDISTLEGWMIKINSNPSLFGKNTSRRWFQVSFVPAGNDEKLIISYSTNKNSKEPRGWLYIEDVSGVYCRRDMIEVVSPARTLRFKGETTVEHRLWSDSLHKLCNPPKPTSLKSIEAAAEEEKRRVAEEARVAAEERERLRQRDRDRIADPKKSFEYVRTRRSIDGADGLAAESKQKRSPSPEKANRRRSSSRDDDDPRKQENEGSDADDDDGDRAPRRRQSMEPSRSTAREMDRERGLNRRRSANDRDLPAEHEELSDRDQRGRASERSNRSPVRDAAPSERKVTRDAKDEDSRESKSQDHRRRRDPSDSARGKSDDDDDDASDDDRRDSDVKGQDKRLSMAQRRPSQLVASIKSLSPAGAVPTASKPRASLPSPECERVPSVRDDSGPEKHATRGHGAEDSDGDDETGGPHETTPRDEVTPLPARHSPRDCSPEQTKMPRSAADIDFDDDDATNNGSHRSSPHPACDEPAISKLRPEVVARTGGVAADNNFVEEDWDEADDEPPAKAPAPASPVKRTPGFGSVAADANFATEDWDD